MRITALETPCVLIDIDVVRRNLERMAALCREAGCALRPHVKTHKSPYFAALQQEYGATGVTVAKLGEAEVMADHGIDDIFMAYPLIGEPAIRRALALAGRVRLILAADCFAAAEAIALAADAVGLSLELRLEVDTGMRRTGVPYDQALELARSIARLRGVRLQGIFTFRGLMHDGKTDTDREKCGLQEGRIMAELAAAMRAAGLPVPDVSVGSTPTAEFCARVPGVTEVRPGTYIFNDMMQLNTGACGREDLAARVLTTVVSTSKPDMLVIDGGCKSFSTDVPPGVFPYFLQGHGTVEGHEDMLFERLSEEHGMLLRRGDPHEFSPGEKLAVIPNHVCPTVNLYDSVYLVRQGRVIDTVPVAARGKSC